MSDDSSLTVMVTHVPNFMDGVQDIAAEVHEAAGHLGTVFGVAVDSYVLVCLRFEQPLLLEVLRVLKQHGWQPMMMEIDDPTEE